MWPWHEFHNNFSTSFITSFFTELSDSFLFIFLKSFCSILSFSRKVLWSKLVLFLFILLSLCQKNRRTNCLNSFVSLFSLCEKNKRTNRLNSFVSPFSLSKRIQRTNRLRILSILPFPLNKIFQRTNRLKYLLFPLTKIQRTNRLRILYPNTFDDASFVAQV